MLPSAVANRSPATTIRTALGTNGRDGDEQGERHRQPDQATDDHAAFPRESNEETEQPTLDDDVDDTHAREQPADLDGIPREDVERQHREVAADDRQRADDEGEHDHPPREARLPRRLAQGRRTG